VGDLIIINGAKTLFGRRRRRRRNRAKTLSLQTLCFGKGTNYYVEKNTSTISVV
jgi:hypothetical protein